MREYEVRPRSRLVARRSLWKPVADAAATSAGHEVTTPTIAGHGKGVDKDVSHDDCVRSIVDHIVGDDLSDVVLVGH